MGEEMDTDDDWASFQGLLATYLRTMTDPEQQDKLLVSLHGDCESYLQFCGFDETMIHAEFRTSSERDSEAGLTAVDAKWERPSHLIPNAYLEAPIEQAQNVAAEAVRILREAFGVDHPQQLTWEAWGPAAECDALELQDLLNPGIPLAAVGPAIHYWHVLHPSQAAADSTRHWYGKWKTREECTGLWEKRESLRAWYESTNFGWPKDAHANALATYRSSPVRSLTAKVCLGCLWVSRDLDAQHPQDEPDDGAQRRRPTGEE